MQLNSFFMKTVYIGHRSGIGQQPRGCAFSGGMLSQELCLSDVPPFQQRCIAKSCAFPGVVPSQQLVIASSHAFPGVMPRQELCFLRNYASQGLCLSRSDASPTLMLFHELCIFRSQSSPKVMPSQSLCLIIYLYVGLSLRDTFVNGVACPPCCLILSSVSDIWRLFRSYCRRFA